MIFDLVLTTSYMGHAFGIYVVLIVLALACTTSSSSKPVLFLFLGCGSLAVGTSQVGLSVRQSLDIRLISLVS
jgi:hypothetical protein